MRSETPKSGSAGQDNINYVNCLAFIPNNLIAQ